MEIAEPVALSWSGGKDSALALRELRNGGIEPAALLTTISSRYRRIAIHGVRRRLLTRQAAAAGVPLVEVELPAGCDNDTYERLIAEAFAWPPLDEVATVAFGDLFLADVRAYRERQLERAGKRGLFPLWGRDTVALAREAVEAGFEAVLVCVDPHTLDKRFAGRRYDHRLLDELPSGVDPCGENGEFHTFVIDGPVFDGPVRCTTGEVVTRDGFTYCDLLAT